MRIQVIIRSALVLFAALSLFQMPAPARTPAPRSAPAQGPDLQVWGSFATGHVSRGGTVRATVTMNIPGGYHANANPASESYLIPTSLKVTGPNGVRIGAVSYPRASRKKFGFSAGKFLSVYEGKVPMSFSVTVPANYSGGELQLQAKVRVQSCDDQTCYAPKNLETTLTVQVGR